MRILLRPSESIYWASRPAYKLRYPLLTLAFFAGLFIFFPFGPVGRDVGTFSFFLFTVFLVVTPASTIRWLEKRFYLTNLRLISRKGEMELSNLRNVSVQQSWLNKIRNLGTLEFDGTNGQWLVFERVKNPELMKTRILSNPEATRLNTDQSPGTT